MTATGIFQDHALGVLRMHVQFLTCMALNLKKTLYLILTFMNWKAVQKPLNHPLLTYIHSSCFKELAGD